MYPGIEAKRLAQSDRGALPTLDHARIVNDLHLGSAFATAEVWRFPLALFQRFYVLFMAFSQDDSVMRTWPTADRPSPSFAGMH